MLAILCASSALLAQEPTRQFTGKEQAGARLERFTLKGGRAYDGIWDAEKSQIHIVQKSNHVANLPVQADEILSRKTIGDGSKVVLYSDVDVAEKILFQHLQNCKSAQTRLTNANRNRDALHAAYKGKNLPSAQYQAVMARYQAADKEVAAAEQFVTTAQTGFAKAKEAYQKAGGKTEYNLP